MKNFSKYLCLVVGMLCPGVALTTPAACLCLGRECDGAEAVSPADCQYLDRGCTGVAAVSPVAGDSTMVRRIPDFNISVTGSFGYVFNTFPTAEQLLASHVYPSGDIRIGHVLRPGKSGKYAEAYNYPNVGIGLSVSGLQRLQFVGTSYLSRLWSLYGFFERDIVRSRGFSFGYDLQFGFGLTSGIYDPVRNPDNTVFGSPLSFCIGAAPYVKFRPSPNLEIGLAARLRHHSFCRLSYPNHGINEVMPNLSVRYHLQDPYVDQGNRAAVREFDKGFRYTVYAGGGVHYCTADWEARGEATVPWPKYTAGFGVSWRYGLKCSSGLMFDAFWTTQEYMDDLKECDELVYTPEMIAERSRGYNPFSCGLFARQDFYYGNFSLWGGVGIYLFKRYGVQEQLSKLYQKIGFQYRFPSLGGLFLAIDCKAHYFSRAEMMEFTAGFQF